MRNNIILTNQNTTWASNNVLFIIYSVCFLRSQLVILAMCVAAATAGGGYGGGYGAHSHQHVQQ